MITGPRVGSAPRCRVTDKLDWGADAILAPVCVEPQ